MKISLILASIVSSLAFTADAKLLFKRANEERFACSGHDYITNISSFKGDNGIKMIKFKCSNNKEEFTIGTKSDTDELKQFKSMRDGYRLFQVKSNNQRVTGIRYQQDKYEISQQGRYKSFFDSGNRICRMYGFKASSDGNGIKTLEPLFCNFGTEETVQKTETFVCSKSGWINKVEAKKDETGIVFVRLFCSTDDKFEIGNERIGGDWETFGWSEDGFRNFGVKKAQKKVIGFRDEMKQFQVPDLNSNWDMRHDTSDRNCRWTGANITASDYHILGFELNFC